MNISTITSSFDKIFSTTLYKRKQLYYNFNKIKGLNELLTCVPLGVSTMNMLGCFIFRFMSVTIKGGPQINLTYVTFSLIALGLSIFLTYKNETSQLDNEEFKENTEKLKSLLSQPENHSAVFSYLNMLHKHFPKVYKEEDNMSLKIAILEKDYSFAVTQLYSIFEKVPTELKKLKEKENLKNYEEQLNEEKEKEIGYSNYL